MPSADTIAGSGGKNTRATAKFTACCLRENGFDSAIAVSRFFHIPRRMMALRMKGVCKVKSVYARYRELEDFFSALLEVPAIFFMRSV